MLVVPPPTRSETSQRFFTYRHYMRAFAGLAGFWQPSDDPPSICTTLAARISALPTCRPQAEHRFDVDALKRSLMNAWGTELLLSMSSVYAVEDELVRLTNNWAAVQLYYVFYHAAQALHIARGNARPDSHPKTKSIYLDMWATRKLDCAPWTLGHAATPVNAPPGHVVDPKVTTIAAPYGDADFLNYAFKALFTTRKECIPEAIRAKRQEKQRALKRNWEREEQNRLSNGKKPRVRPRFRLPLLLDDEKAACQDSVRCHTLMDFLWRLRTRANYQDGLILLEGPTDDRVSASLNADMRHLAFATMLLFEMHIAKVVGGKAMAELINSWLTRNSVANTNGVGQRVKYVLA